MASLTCSCPAEACHGRRMAMTDFYLRVCKSKQVLQQQEVDNLQVMVLEAL